MTIAPAPVSTTTVAPTPTTSLAAGGSVVPFLDLPAQSAEIADEVLPAWRELLLGAGFVGGGEVAAFEREYAAYIGGAAAPGLHAIGVSNGTDALELAYRAVGVRPGDEVIVPANTFIATAAAASRIGAVPVFVDVDETHLLMDPDAVEAAITPRTRAIVPVHLFGRMAPLERIAPIARRHGLAIVEDAAQAQGAAGRAGRAGAVGDVAATSFYPGKNLGAAGDAGAVTTPDPGLAETVRSLQAHGSRSASGSGRYVHDRIGVNARLDAVQAVVLRAKLRRLDAWNTARRAAASTYAELLGGLDGVRLPQTREGGLDVWHLYVVRVLAGAEARDRVAAELTRAGIGVGIHYPTPVPLTPAYAHLGLARGAFPVAEAAAERILSLPMGPHLTLAQQVAVAEALRQAVA